MLKLEPAEPDLKVESRLCVYSQLDDNGGEWRLPADKPVYKHMYSLVMESINGDE